MISSDDAKRNLSANIKRLLADRGWSQTELCQRTEQAHATISRTINGLNVPSAVVLARIAEALDVSIDRLLAPPSEKTLASS